MTLLWQMERDSMLTSPAAAWGASSNLAAVFGPWLLRLDNGYLSQFGLLLPVSMLGCILCSAAFIAVRRYHQPQGLA